MASELYCLIDGVEYGPYALDDLRGMVASGKLRPTDLVRISPDGNWIAAGNFEGLDFRPRQPSSVYPHEGVQEGTRPPPPAENSVQLSCPQCASLLKAPRELLGNQVKCPTCQTIFIAAEEQRPSSPPPPQGDIFRRDPDPWPSTPPRKSRYDEDDDYDRPRRPDYGDDPEPMRRRDWRPQRPNVSGLVIAPAIALLVTGVMGILIDLFQVAAALFWPQLLKNNLLRQETPPEISAIAGIIFAVMSIAIVVGSISMIRMRVYGLCMTATILSMINVGNCCCLLGLPFGIWSLVILCRQDVRDAFRDYSY